MKIILTCLVLVFLSVSSLFAQNVAINNDGSAANPSAMLDVKSSTKGVLIPRMSSTQRDAIVSPAPGLFVYDSTQKTLYMFDGQQWLGFAPLTNFQRPANNFVYGPDKSDTSLAGYSVSMWDQFVAIGVPYRHVTGGTFTGAVYIYKLVAGDWQYFTTLSPTGNTDLSYYGISVCLKGNYLIVGASNHKNGSNQRTGAAYIYNYNGISWVPQQTIFGPAVDSSFGTAVAINQFGTYAAVSQTNATASALTTAGVVRIYNNTGTFTLQTTIQDASPAAGEGFGACIAMSPSGNHLIVGAPSKTVSGHYGNGYVGQFDRSGSSWPQNHSYTPISQDNLGIGSQVDITDNKVLFVTSKIKEVSYLDLSWTGYAPPALPDVINSISLDPASDNAYVFSGNSIYAFGGSTNTKLKTLSIDQPPSLRQLLSFYNKRYVVGIPYGANADKVYTGAIYFGLSAQ